jgi:hypothetical protein
MGNHRPHFKDNKEMNDQQTEQAIQDKGLTAPRVTPQRIKDVIISAQYFTAYAGVKHGRITRDEPAFSDLLQMVTFCVLILQNGHRIIGVNAGPVSAENFDSDLARKLAMQNALDQIWPLEGYLLKQRLHDDAAKVA